MGKLKQYLPPLFTLLLIVLGAAMPWLASRVQDARISRLQEKLALNAVNLTLQEDAGAGPALQVVSGEYTAAPWENETRMTEQEALNAVNEVIDQLCQYELFLDEEIYFLLKEDSRWSEPFLVVAGDGSTALVWRCYWAALPCVMAVDDASGKVVQFLIENTALLEKKWDKEGRNQREQWNQFFWDYYGMELADVEGLNFQIYQDYVSFNF